MKLRLLVLFLLVGSLRVALAQTASWYAVQNNVLGLKNGATFKVLKEPLTLPNGNRLEPLKSYVVLPTGEHATL
ncbi:MAG: hypothetical protein EOO55_05095, partial [Hymenobacter sp.]